MQRVLTLVIALAMSAGSLVARVAGDTKAAELLAKARAAVGGEKQVSKVQGLSCAGTVQRMMGGRQMSGELTIDLQLPDKMLRTESLNPMGDAIIVTEQGINGDRLLRNTRILNAPPNAVMRTPPPPAAGSDAETQAIRGSRAELARLTVALLLASPASLPAEFSYAGEAESPDGKADVLDVRGPSSFAAKLFLDQSTHRPLMLAYRGIAPRVVVQTQQSSHTDPAAAPAPAAPPAQEPVDITMFFDDFKPVDGVLLPHHITRSVAGETAEEWTFKTIKVNPSFKSDAFGK